MSYGNLADEITVAQLADVPVPEVTAEKPLFDYKEESTAFNSLRDANVKEAEKCATRRRVRRHKVNTEELKTRGDAALLADETVIPDRTIETNLRRDKSTYVKYVEKATTVLNFTDTAAPQARLDAVSRWHTEIVRSGDWRRPLYLLIDSLELHGAGWLEVVFDPTSPSRTAKEYIRREDLLIPEKTRTLQACTRLYRRYQVTKEQFKKLAVKYGFDETVAKLAFDKEKSGTALINIYKGYLRNDTGTVHIAWRTEGDSAETWLKAPEPLDLGIYSEGIDELTGQPSFNPVPINVYPVFCFPYELEEDETIYETQGRAALDLHVQEALTSLITSTANGSNRASRFYPTRKPSADGNPRNQESVILKHGCLNDGDIDVFQPNWPSPIALSVAQLLTTRNATQAGATDFAAMSRQDTAKTATELTLAQTESDELSSARISLFSFNLLSAETLCFLIIRSQVKVGEIKTPPTFNPAQLFSPTLTWTMAADTQVVLRAQTATKFQQYFPYVQNTPFALPFISAMLQEVFPEFYPQWKQEVGELDQNKQLLQSAFQVLSNMPAEAVPPDAIQPFKQLLNNIGQALNPRPQK